MDALQKAEARIADLRQYLDASRRYVEAIRAAMGAYHDSDLVSLSDTMRRRTAYADALHEAARDLLDAWGEGYDMTLALAEFRTVLFGAPNRWLSDRDWTPEINEYMHRCELIRARDGAVSDDSLRSLLSWLFDAVRSEAFGDAARLVDQRLTDTQRDHMGAEARDYMIRVMQETARKVRQANG